MFTETVKYINTRTHGRTEKQKYVFTLFTVKNSLNTVKKTQNQVNLYITFRNM